MQAAAVSLCTLLFLSVGISSIAAFGPKVPADVLEAFDQEYVLHFFCIFMFVKTFHLWKVILEAELQSFRKAY